MASKDQADKPEVATLKPGTYLIHIYVERFKQLKSSSDE